MSGDGGQRARVLLVDDDRDLLALLGFLVEQAGLEPLVASDPVTALELFEKREPAVAVVDLGLRPWDGFELLAELRRRSASLPIIVLTARNHEDDKVRALDMGADDYVVKPFGHRELVARVRARVRRAENEKTAEITPSVLEVGRLRLDAVAQTLEVDGEILRLTATELRLLQYLMANSNTVVPTAAVAKHVWGYDDAPAREVLRVTAYRLRRKLGGAGEHRRLIHTVPGVGLKLLAG
jgi:DNA-binding response OmpR family regulator